MSERKDLNLNINDILNNNFLIADFLVVKELRLRLSYATEQDLKLLTNHFSVEKNVKSFASIFKSNKYHDYLKDKNSNHDLDLLKETATELSGVGILEILYRAVQSLVGGIKKHDKAVEEFLTELEKLSMEARIEGMLGTKAESYEEMLKREGKKEFAKELLNTGNISIDAVREAGIFTEEEFKEVEESQ